MVIIPRWIIALFLYILIITVLILFKPAIMFDAEGNMKPPGTGILYGASPFSPTISFPIIAMICYIISCLSTLALT
jgi:hypothetical protein